MKYLFWIMALVLPTSIAGMEFFGWLVALFAFIFHFKSSFKLNKSFKSLFTNMAVGGDIFLWGLWIVVILGVLLNGNSETSYRYVIGNFRWIILLYGYSLAWKYWGIKQVSKFILWGIAPVLFVVSIYGIIQTFTGLDLIRPGREIHNLHLAGILVYRSSGFFNNPMTYAHLFVMWFSILIGLMLKGGLTKRENNWLKVVIATIGIGLLFSLIRGVWISAYVSIMTIIWLHNKKLFKNVMLASLVSAGIIISTVAPIRERVVSIFGTKNIENKDRVLLWSTNFEIFKDYPFFGIGYTENERRLPEYYKRSGIEDGFIGHAHNVYLQFLAGTGIIGLFLYLGFILSFLRESFLVWKNSAELKRDFNSALILGVIGAQVSLHIGAMTQNNFSDGEVTHNFIFLLALFVCLKKDYSSTT